MKKVLWTLPAEAQLSAIADYIAKDNLSAALRTVNAIREHAASLAELSSRGRPGSVANTRELLIPRLPYISLGDNTVEIVSVFHPAQDDWPPDEALH